MRLLLLILAAGATASAATIVGTVRDPSGAVIPGAAIELRSEVTGKQTAITADAVGRFRAPGLAAGSYQIKIEHSGFRTYSQAAVLEDTQTNAFEFRLETAEVEQAVQVAGKSAAG